MSGNNGSREAERSRVTVAEAVLLLTRVPTASEKGVQSRDGDRNRSSLQPRGMIK